MGERTVNKPRPLLVGFKTVNDRNHVMEASTKSEDKSLSFKSDLTKMQREENSKLRVEVQNLNNTKPSDDSGDYRWKLVGPPEMLRKAKVRDIEKWEREEAIRIRPKSAEAHLALGEVLGNEKVNDGFGAIKHTVIAEKLF